MTTRIKTESIICRASFAAPQLANLADGEMMYLPAGVHTITPSQGGRTVEAKVLVARDAALEMERERKAIIASGRKPYFDFNHEDREASFWPEEFFWKDGPDAGVYARGEYSDLGETAIKGKRYRQFSPVFYVDNVRANPAKIVCRANAKPNMGGLVNDPAFSNILAFFAKNAAGAQSSQQNQNINENMTPEELAALQAKNKQLETDIAALKAKEEALKAKNESDAVLASELKAKVSELKAGKLEEENAALEAKNKKHEEAVSARNATDAKSAVADAVKRGAIAAKDKETIEAWEKDITENPARAALLAKMPGTPALTQPGITRQTTALAAANGGRIEMGGADPADVFKELEALIASNGTTTDRVAKTRISRDFAAIYAREFRRDSRCLDMPLVGANSVGTLAGTLVTQRTLELLKLTFPALLRITQDFSDEPANYNQTITTRVIGIPGVSTYDPVAGWTSEDVTDTDVSVTINQHKGVPIVFDSNTLASTVRRLFDEHAPAASYALAKNMVDYVYALITTGNFTAAPEVAALADFARANVINIGTDLNLRGVPMGAMNRTLLLYSSYFGKLAQDQAIVTLAAFQKSEIITAGTLPDVHGFSVVDAPNLPNTSNLVGFGFSRSALVLATRMPNDYTKVLPGASFGNVMTVTDPDLGISVMQVQYVNHDLGAATQRIALMYGASKGQANSGQLLTSA